ncbi:MAG: hypothetical protein V2A70_07900, partial [Candidatus Omnitrophota bacterium]
MGRLNRKDILYDGCYAHIFSRAADKRNIFSGDEDFEKFKTLLVESKVKFFYRIHHYCFLLHAYAFSPCGIDGGCRGLLGRFKGSEEELCALFQSQESKIRSFVAGP